MPIGPETQAYLDELSAAGGKPVHAMSIEEARASTAEIFVDAGDRPRMVSEQDHRLAVPGGDILLRVLTPRPDPKAVIVFYHGGGWTVGDAEMYTTFGCQIAAATGCIVVVVDYRRAPEHRFPVPLDDSYAATLWTAERFALPLVVMGDSAGGNIAAAITQRARDADGPDIAAQVLIYPSTDYRTDWPSINDREKQRLLTPEGLEWFRGHYVPDPADRADPMVSPLMAESLAGLPPAIVLLARYDMLLDEGLAYAERLRAEGTACTLRISEGEIHGFIVMCGRLQAARRAIADIAQDLDALLAP